MFVPRETSRLYVPPQPERMHLHRTTRIALSLATVALAATAAPARAQDTAHVRQTAPHLDSLSTALTRYCKTNKALAYMCRTKVNVAAVRSLDAHQLLPVRVDTIVRTDTIVRVDTVYATKPDTSHPPTPPDSITTPDTTYAWVHPYAPPANGAAFAEFPRETVTVKIPAPTRTIAVASLQTALDTAQTGDRLLIPANHTDNCLLVKATPRASWVTVQGTDSTSVITCAVGGSTSTIGIQSQAHHVRFLGPLSIRAASDATNAIVRSYNGETSRSQLAHDFIFDGVTIDSRNYQVRRCAWPDGIRMAIVNSRLLGCASKSGDAQAIIVLNGGGPYRFQGNYLEGGHQCFMSGGGDPSIKDDAPSDIYFADNTCFKPARWHFTTRDAGGSPIYLGDERQTKTGIETKNIRRALFERNVIRVTYADAQAGFCWLLKSTNQDGTAPNSQTVDVTARYNLCDQIDNGMNLAAHPQGGLPMTRVSVYGNIFKGMSTNGSMGIDLQMLDDLRDMVIMHNSWDAAGNTAITFDGAPTQRNVITANDLVNGMYGVKGSGTASGTATLNKWLFPTGLFEANIVFGASCSTFPPGTICTRPVPRPIAPDGTPIGADSTKVPR